MIVLYLNYHSHSLENAKALLEAVGKEICTSNAVELGTTPSINSVLKSGMILSVSL